MGFKTSGEFIELLIDKGVLPEDTVSAEIILNWTDVPIIRCERMPHSELVELIITSIGETEELAPPSPPAPRVYKPPATEPRGI